MAKRYIGDAVITVTYRDGDYRRPQGYYDGSVCVPAAGRRRHCQSFNVGTPAAGFGPGIAYDSPEAYDDTAQAAASFASHDDSDVDDYLQGWLREDGTYEIRRSPGGRATNYFWNNPVGSLRGSG